MDKGMQSAIDEARTVREFNEHRQLQKEAAVTSLEEINRAIVTAIVYSDKIDDMTAGNVTSLAATISDALFSRSALPAVRSYIAAIDRGDAEPGA